MKRLLSAACALLLLLTTLTACTSRSSQNADSSSVSGKKPVVAVTVVPEATFAKAVCGDLMTVITSVPPGYSPENYEPTPKEKEELANASLYFAVGVPAEEATILPVVADQSSTKIIRLQDAVAKQYEDRTFASGERDPHIWLSPKRAKVMVETIAEQCGELDPQNKDQYEENAKAYSQNLDSLDQELKQIFSKIESKSFLVFHPAFGYLAEDYGLTMYALQEEGKEATPQHLQKMVDLAKEQGVKAIFYQDEIDSKQSKAFAEEIGGKTIGLSPLAADYIENLKKMAATMAEAMK
ncbi:MAG: zinc ABC transporter substrate-binding protein [Oscillospiraceae bacterium]|jgi:zinc transport system substrate-binding protein|nr:zinc ABC transporter substrate-binding protein [Oscillospiraceae bacterium]